MFTTQKLLDVIVVVVQDVQGKVPAHQPVTASRTANRVVRHQVMQVVAKHNHQVDVRTQVQLPAVKTNLKAQGAKPSKHQVAPGKAI